MGELVQNMVRATTQLDCGQGNPDISGIGVRLSFYLQTFLLVLLVDRSWQDAPGALWTFITTSFGLTLSAIAQAGQGQLSFFQALQVSNLVWLANFGCFLSVASYSRCKAHYEETSGQDALIMNNKCNFGAEKQADLEQPKNTPPMTQPGEMAKQVVLQTIFSVKGGVIFQILFSMVLTLVAWANPSMFSNGPEESQGNCDVRYVAFFAKEFPARESGRTLGLAATSILLFAYLGTTLHELRSSYLHRARREERMKNKLDTAQNKLEKTQSGTLRQVKDPRKPPRRVGMRAISSGCDPMLLGITIIQIVVFTYFIVCTEILLTRGFRQREQDMGFWPDSR